MSPRFFLIFLLSLTTASAAPTIQLVVPTYDIPGNRATDPHPLGISDNGTVVGSFNYPGFNQVAYERLPNGRIGRLLVPGSIETIAEDINNAGIICGEFDGNHGFFYDGHTYTQYDAPGGTFTDLTGINDAGDFCGTFFQNGGVVAFVNVAGTLTPFSIPGTNYVVVPEDINNLGQVVGYYYDPADPGTDHGFFRDTDGTLTYPLDYPESIITLLLGLNDKGLIVGTRQDTGYHYNACLLDRSNHFISYDYPGGDSTIFRAINNEGFISGDYQDQSNGASRAFIARVGR